MDKLLFYCEGKMRQIIFGVVLDEEIALHYCILTVLLNILQ